MTDDFTQAMIWTVQAETRLKDAGSLREMGSHHPCQCAIPKKDDATGHRPNCPRGSWQRAAKELESLARAGLLPAPSIQPHELEEDFIERIRSETREHDAVFLREKCAGLDCQCSAGKAAEPERHDIHCAISIFDRAAHSLELWAEPYED